MKILQEKIFETLGGIKWDYVNSTGKGKNTTKELVDMSLGFGLVQRDTGDFGLQICPENKRQQDSTSSDREACAAGHHEELEEQDP